MKMVFSSRSIRSLCNQLQLLNVGIKQSATKDVICRRNLEIPSTDRLGLVRGFLTSLPRRKIDDRRILIQSMPAKDEGTEGERLIGIDYIKSREDMFPCEDTPNMLFNGIPFKEIPVVHIRSSPNNTIMTLFDAKDGKVKITRSCGVEGFKNTRKGTNVAAQATAISFTTLALNKGYKTIRVSVSGLGPGRLSAIKGLEMAGMEIISVSDHTPVSENPPRPPRPRSL